MSAEWLTVVPTTATALTVVLLAIVPGFIATSTWARARTWKGYSTDFRTTLQSIAISSAIQVLVSPLTVYWIVPVRSHLVDHPGRLAIWGFIVVLAFPVVAGLGVARFNDWFQKPMRSAVDTASLGCFRRAWAVVVKGAVSPSIWDWFGS